MSDIMLSLSLESNIRLLTHILLSLISLIACSSIFLNHLY
jgi:hypothetical protein